MKFEKPLLEGLLIKRYKRFFADIVYQNKNYTIHVPNTGSLKGVIDKDKEGQQKCWFSLHGDSSKKLAGTLEAVCTTDGVWVGVNTSNPNKLVTEAISQKSIWFEHWPENVPYKPEYKISKETRLDGAFIINEKKRHFIEIKNTTYFEKRQDKGVALFPDAVTERGQKHLIEMMKLIDEGHTCELIFTVQRSDAGYFKAAELIDKTYADLLQQAIKKGLIVSPLVVDMNQREIILTNKKLLFI